MVHRLSFFCVPEKKVSNTGLHQQDEWTMRSFSAEWRAWHISPRLYTNKTLDLMRTNCLPRWCFWRHDTPLTRVSVSVRAQQLASECSGVRVSECVLLVECGSCPHALYEQPTCPNSARVAEDVTPTKTADASSQHSLWSVIGGKSAVHGRVGAGRN